METRKEESMPLGVTTRVSIRDLPWWLLKSQQQIDPIADGVSAENMLLFRIAEVY